MQRVKTLKASRGGEGSEMSIPFKLTRVCGGESLSSISRVQSNIYDSDLMLLLG